MVSTIVLYNELSQMNKIRKLMQRLKVSLETIGNEITAVIEFLLDFRECGFNSAKTDEVEMN